MKLNEYLETEGRGAASRLATAIGAYPSDVSDWAKEHRPVPIKAAVAIEQETDGRVTRWEMHPDDWHLIWPELVGAKGAPPVHAEQGAA